MRRRKKSIILKCNYINDTVGITMPKEIVKHDSETLPQFCECDVCMTPPLLRQRDTGLEGRLKTENQKNCLWVNRTCNHYWTQGLPGEAQ